MFARIVAIAAAVAAMHVGCTAASAADDAVPGFFRDRTLRLVMPSSPGGGLDANARIFAKHIPRFLPGKPTVVVESHPGGGGTVGAAYVYNVAPRDGSVLGILLPTSILEPLLRKSKFDAKALQWLGAFGDSPAIISVWHTTAIKSLDDAKRREVILGATGKGSNMYMIPALANYLFGTKFKVVTGYKGGAAINQAIESGEVQGRAAAWSAFAITKKPWLSDHKLVHLMQIGNKIPGLDRVPSMEDLARTRAEKQMVAMLALASDVGDAFFYPPLVPKPLVDAMRNAMAKAVSDEAFLADVRRYELEFNPVGGERIQAMVADVFDTPRPVVDKLKAVLYGGNAKE